MSGCPQYARAEIQIAVTDDTDRQYARTLVGQSHSDGRLCVVADTESATVSPVAMVLIEIQQDTLPVACELMAGTDTPIVILNLGTQFSNHALDADRTDVPTVSCFLQLLDAFFMMCRCDLHSASIERAPLFRCDQSTDFFDE